MRRGESSVFGQVVAAVVFVAGGLASTGLLHLFGLEGFALGFAAYVGGWGASMRIEDHFRLRCGSAPRPVRGKIRRHEA